METQSGQIQIIRYATVIEHCKDVPQFLDVLW